MVLKATKDQMISRQVWRIPLERISINRLRERPEEVIRVYTYKVFRDLKITEI